MNERGDRIAAARVARGLRQEDLASLIGTSRPTLCRYETGVIKTIPDEKIKALAQALHVSVAYLQGFDDTPSFADTEDVIYYPVMYEVAAGFDQQASEWDGEQIAVPRSFLRGRSVDEYFAMRVKGTSMEPDYREGDIVLALKQATLNRSGDVGIILYQGDLITLKQVEFKMGEDWMLLKPLNMAEHSPEMIRDEELEKCRVLGIPKMVIREIQP